MSTTNEHHMIHGHGSWNIICNTEFVVILGLFLLLHPRDDPENQSFEKLKKIPRDVTILHMCIINDIWWMHLPFLSFYFYPPNNPENLNFEKMKKTPGDIIILQMRIINDNIMTKWQDFFSFFFFFHFWSLFTPPQNQNFPKNEKIPGDIVILHKGTKNHGYMLQCSSDTTRDRCNFYFSFWTIFFPFTPLTTQKNFF